MYSRSYGTGEMLIPESYGGTALKEAPEKAQNHIPDTAQESSAEPQKKQSFFDGLKSLPLFSSFGELGLKSHFSMPKFTLEEILIAACALFLIFSDEKDIVFGILLIALLFIN